MSTAADLRDSDNRVGDAIWAENHDYPSGGSVREWVIQARFEDANAIRASEGLEPFPMREGD
jgi:hypothetical protein